jgi:hypothetical protein
MPAASSIQNKRQERDLEPGLPEVRLGLIKPIASVVLTIWTPIRTIMASASRRWPAKSLQGLNVRIIAPMRFDNPLGKAPLVMEAGNQLAREMPIREAVTGQILSPLEKAIDCPGDGRRDKKSNG